MCNKTVVSLTGTRLTLASRHFDWSKKSSKYLWIPSMIPYYLLCTLLDYSKRLLVSSPYRFLDCALTNPCVMSKFLRDSVLTSYRYGDLLDEIVAEGTPGKKVKLINWNKSSQSVLPEHSLADLTTRAQAHVTKEFSGPLPLIKITHFAVMRFCFQL